VPDRSFFSPLFLSFGIIAFSAPEDLRRTKSSFFTYGTALTQPLHAPDSVHFPDNPKRFPVLIGAHICAR
jgi:hypothetical protein